MANSDKNLLNLNTWRWITIVGTIVAGTFWIIDKVDHRIKQSQKEIKIHKITKECDRQIMRELQYIRKDVDRIYEEFYNASR